MLPAKNCIILMYIVIAIKNGMSVTKYSAELNQKIDFNAAEKPFRMNKVNLLWEKAQKRLGPEKLKNLYSDLKLQDKEEMTLKHLKAENGDKDGLKEAALRRRFKALVDRYDLGEHLQHIEETLKSKSEVDTNSNEATEGIGNKNFRDQKLKKLWQTAEKSGFTKEELKMLHEELGHHQEKLDEYHQLMDELGTAPDPEAFDNSLNQLDSDSVPNASEKLNSFKENSQLLKEKYRDLKKSYEKLNKLTRGEKDDEFQEFRVQELWNLAQKANFNQDELESLKEELHHYEHRVKKLKHFETQVDFNTINDDKWHPDHKLDERKHMEQRIKQYSHKVEKIHNDLESRIMQRHLEL